MANNKLYTKDSIESLSPLEFTRLRPQVYVGDCSYSTQLLVEILSNSIDEFRLGHGSKIEVDIDNDIVTVKDNGQGFIVDSYRDDGKTILEAAFSILNTSGKYREDGTYEGTSLGSYGIGSKLVVFLSNWAEITTFRDGKSEYIKFVEGVFSERKINKKTSESSGTIVRWKPSSEFFTDPKVEINKVKNLFKVVTCLCSGLTIELNDNGKHTTYYSDKGLNELADEAVKDNELINNRFEMKFAEGKNKMDMILTYTSNYSCMLIPYVNTGLTEKGLHITQVKTIITREFNKFFRDKKWLKEKEDNLTGDDIQEGMYIVFNITAPGVAYDAQVKSTVSKIDMSPFTNALVENLRYWMENNEKEIKLIADKALSARKAREAAKKARDAARNQTEKKTKALKFASKLADCNAKNRSQCEIYITEGDSATGGLKMGRNEQFQAVMPIRGKVLNCQKASLAQIQKNAEIMTMIEAFGLSIDTKTMKITYKPEDLRYGKIIIMSDADVNISAYERLFA